MEPDLKRAIRGTVGFFAGVGIGVPFAVVALGMLFALPELGFVAFVTTLLAFGIGGAWLGCCAQREIESPETATDWQTGDWSLAVERAEDVPAGREVRRGGMGAWPHAPTPT